MRLQDHEVRAILEASRKVFGPDAEVRLFGSRTDDSRTGGDIDLHITVAADVDRFSAQGDFLVDLWKRLGDDQEIDVVVHRREDELRLVDRIAYDRGIRLH